MDSLLSQAEPATSRTAPEIAGAMNVNEFARYVGVSPRTVYRWIRTQQVHPLRRGGQWVFGESEVAEVLRRT